MELNITEKELQEIGLKLIAAASDADYIELYIYANEVHLRKKNKAQCERAMSVPLLKKV